jgi:tRNA threonylcarbamoyladenosine biosynthesis protein TsaE
MPILDANVIEFFSNSAEQTGRLGIQLGGLLHRGDLICLEGELGAGKTTLVQGIAAGWGSADTVTSPTFILVNIYRRGDGEEFAHLDAYRLESAAEADALDLDELLARGPMVVEWAPRIRAALPAENLWLKLIWVDEERRRLELSSTGARYHHMREAFRELIFGLQ